MFFNPVKAFNGANTLIIVMIVFAVLFVIGGVIGGILYMRKRKQRQ